MRLSEFLALVRSKAAATGAVDPGQCEVVLVVGDRALPITGLKFVLPPAQTATELKFVLPPAQTATEHTLGVAMRVEVRL